MTPYRICIIGDSHVAALKNGWDEIAPQYPHVEVLYFAKPSTSLMEVVREGSCITLGTRKGKRFLRKTFGYEELDTSGVDAFLCAGMMTGVHGFIKMQLEHKLVGQTDEASQFVSEAAYLAAYRDIYKNSVLAHVARTLAGSGVSKGFVTLDPCRSAELLELGTWAAPVYEVLIAGGYGPKLSSLVKKAMEDILPDGFHYLPPLNEMLLDDLLTRKEFSSGSVRLRSEREHSERDIKHMNAEYGKRVLTAMLEQIGIEPHETPERDLQDDR